MTLLRRVSGSGGNLVGLGYLDVAIFTGTVFLKSAEICVSVFEICAKLWVPVEETC